MRSGLAGYEMKYSFGGGVKKQIVEKKVLIILAFMLVSIIIPGSYFDTVTDSGMTLVGFIKGHISLFLVMFSLLMTACYTTIRFLYRKIDQFNECIYTDSFQQIKTIPTYWVIIFICWFPYLIVCAPASSVGWDYNWQLLQGTGVVPFSNHHPVLGSLIYGFLYKTGFIINGAYGGLFFTGFFQVALMSFAMAYGISTVRRMGAPKKVVWCLIIFTCLCPMFAGHAVWLIKDSIYASLIVILLSLCLNCCSDRNKAFYPFQIGIVGFLVTMYRSEGIVIVLLFYIALIFVSFRKIQKKSLCRIIVSFVSVLVLFMSFKIGIRTSGIPSGSSVRESTTLFSAQIMHCLKKHPSDISAWEKEVLQKAYSNLKIAVLKYNDRTRDPIKTVDMGFSQTMDYMKVWFRIGVRHKGDYIDSFLRGTNGYWWLFKSPNLIFHTTPLYASEGDFANIHRRDTKAMSNSWLRKTYESYGLAIDKKIGELVLENNPDLEGIFYVKSSFPHARNSLNKLLSIWKKLPLLQFIFVPGFYYLISLLSMGYLFIRKRTVFWQCMPIMVIVIVCCLSPINGYMRYFLPVALSSVLMAGLCFTGKGNSLGDLAIDANETSSNSDSVLK